MLAQVQWGDVGSWVGAVLTAATLLFSLLLIRTQRKELREDKEEKQARLVSAWPSELLDPTTANDAASLRCSYFNRSDEPIYGMEVGTPNRTRDDLAPIWRRVGTVAPGFLGQCDIGLPLKPEFNRTKDDPGTVSRFRDAAVP